MKIRNDHIQALQDTEVREKTLTPKDGFAALLDGELDKVSGGTPAKIDQALQVESLTGLRVVSGVTETQAVLARSETSGLTANQVDGLISSLESYSAQLASGNEDGLKKAFGLLEHTASQLNALRSTFPDLEAQQPELANMVNELDILTTTEIFKFNRGDYL